MGSLDHCLRNPVEIGEGSRGDGREEREGGGTTKGLWARLVLVWSCGFLRP